MGLISRLEVGLLVLILGFLVINTGVDGKTRVGEKNVEDEIDRKLKLLNKPAVKTIYSEDGDIIDCVDIYKQPTFDHLALKDHKIQMRPSFVTTTLNKNNRSDNSTMTMSQTWHRSGICSKGTIPIRRIRREDLLRLESLELFGKKPTALKDVKVPPFVRFDNGTESKIGEYTNRSIATLVTVEYNYLGARAELNTWNPTVESREEFTSAQIWLKAGPGDNFESVESGWMVNPSLYGDRLTRFFGHWTLDAYKSKGCFDLTCPGFVQTSSKIGLGASVGAVSTTNGPQHFITIEMRLDPTTGNWWLRYNYDNIGYWPGALFGYLRHSSILVEWGGEVYSPNVMKSPHTKTGMGSGDFANGQMGHACFARYPRVMDNSPAWKYPDSVGMASNEPYCYSTLNVNDGSAREPVFYFGGPGAGGSDDPNLNCQ